MRRVLLALVAGIAVPTAGQAQFAATIPAAAVARAGLLAEEPAAAAPTVRVESGRVSAPLIGFVVGAALGVAAGYGTFNVFCEAVDNQCEGSRPLYMAVGGLTFGGLGALVGVLID